MKINKIIKVENKYDTIIVPVLNEEKSLDYLTEIFSNENYKAVNAVVNSDLNKNSEQVISRSIIVEDNLINIITICVDNDKTPREKFLHIAKAFKKCKELKSQKIAVLMNSIGNTFYQDQIIQKVFELPYLVDYEFDYYKSKKNNSRFVQVDYCVAEADDISFKIDEIINLAEINANSTLLARDLTNHPSCYMTPQKFAAEAFAIGKECEIEVELLHKEEIKELNMKAFLSVGAGSKNEPILVVMKYNGGVESDEKIALVGKGIMYDSGGYSLKAKAGMITMHHDMGGGAAVLGAMRAISRAKLGVNVVGIVAACENKIGPDAYVPGDVIGSMAGKTIQVTSTDGEGRLILADAITYAIRIQNADKIVDIATLTGGSSVAVGNRTAAVITNSECLWGKIKTASVKSCEKVWRLDADEELKYLLKSNIADMRNAITEKKIGGTIVAALFIKEFIEKKPWIHVDMAPVGWVTDEQPNNPKGASGYGVSLLFNLIKLM